MVNNSLNAILLHLRLWLIIINIFNVLLQIKKKVIRRWWTKPQNEEHVRQSFGAYATVFSYFILYDEEEFKKFLRMSVAEFAYLY